MGTQNSVTIFREYFQHDQKYTDILVSISSFVNLIIFQTGNRLKSYFICKDCVSETLQSNFIYKFKCGSSTASYYGKTYSCMKFWVLEYQSMSPRTFKQVKGTLSTSVKNHMLTSSLGKFLLNVCSKESLFIKRQKSFSSVNKYSQELFFLVILVEQFLC